MKPSPAPHLSSWEQDYLSSPLVNNPQDVATASHSKLELSSPLGINSSVTLGSEVKFTVTLFNYRNEPRSV
ncbi:NXPE family member 3, partial [Biomphalaria pfeifferi]